MAGEIQLNSTTMATESSGSITAELDTIRPNTTNGSLTLQGDSSNAGVTGLTIDSSGNATFAQTISGGTIGSSVINDDYGYAQVKLTGNVSTQGFITFNTIVGDSNFTISSELITLPYSGIYHIIFSASGQITSNTPERNFQSAIYTGGGSLLTMAKDQVSYLDSSTSFANGTSSYVGSFSSSDTVKCYFKSDGGADVDLDSSSHVSIILIRRTA